MRYLVVRNYSEKRKDKKKCGESKPQNFSYKIP